MHAHRELADEMREARVGRAPADADDPSAEDRSIDQRVAPQQVRDPMIAIDEVAHGVMRDQRHLGRHQGGEVVIHHLDEKTLQIGDVAGDMKRQYLPPARRHRGVTAGKAFQNETDDARPVAFAHDVFLRVEHPDGRAQVRQRTVLGLGRIGDGLQLPQQRQQVSALH